jgi:(S)-2-hydroxyglutarate dehydrogenase
MKYDVAIIGAGIVGLATAYKLATANPLLEIAVIEKEDGVAKHQTGNNSGVIHSGIYYKPGSLKAINCKQGYDELLIFAREYGIIHEVCGKVIVATDDSEKGALDNIYKRGIANGLVGIKKITSQEVKEIEPHVHSVEAIWVPQTGIIDFKGMSRKYAELIENVGNSIFFNRKVINIIEKNGVNVLNTEGGDIEAKVVINCAGLYSDKVAKMTQPEVDMHILPFRGEYYELKKEKEYLVKNLIYPVPNPDFPFLGVHFTRMALGGIEAGPNAVFAFKREGYKRSDIHFGELMETLGFSGFRKVAVKYWREGLEEMHRSYSKRAFVKALQKLIPEIQEADVLKGGAGVRAQACDAQGNLIDDFLILEKNNIINVCNAPSPAATASLAIGETIAAKALAKL